MPCNAFWATAQNKWAAHQADETDQSLHEWLIATLEYISCFAGENGNEDLETSADDLIGILTDAGHSFDAPPTQITQNLSAALDGLTTAVNVSGQVNSILAAGADFAEAVSDHA